MKMTETCIVMRSDYRRGVIQVRRTTLTRLSLFSEIDLASRHDPDLRTYEVERRVARANETRGGSPRGRRSFGEAPQTRPLGKAGVSGFGTNKDVIRKLAALP